MAPTSKLRLCHASLSEIARDQRILRAGEAARMAGLDVTFAGYGAGVVLRPFHRMRKLAIAVRQMPANALPAEYALRAYWLDPEVRELAAAMRAARPDIIHAHDWNALPAAAAVARDCKARLIYDSHEFGSEMRAERRAWRFVFQRFVTHLESRTIEQADIVITVGQALAQVLQELYNLPDKPLIIRNVPRLTPVAFRPTNPDRILLHFHGNIRSGLGIAAAIKVLSRLPKRFCLRIVGRDVEPGFVATLRDLAADLNVADRVEIRPPVPYAEVIQMASEADIGLMLNEAQTRHHNVLAPNKLYEYLMSGLMLLCGPSPDMAHVCQRSGGGLHLSSGDDVSVAQAISALTVDQINEYRRRSLSAAPEFSWERERQRLIDVYRALIADKTAAADS